MIKVVLFDVGNVLVRLSGAQFKLYKLADKIKSNGIRISILSNVFFVGGWFLRWLHLYKGFSPVVLSYQEGVRKPDLRIYQITMERLGVKPEEVVFIDNLAENLAPARQLGIHTIHCTSTKQAIKELTELLNRENNLQL